MFQNPVTLQNYLVDYYVVNITSEIFQLFASILFSCGYSKNSSCMCNRVLFCLSYTIVYIKGNIFEVVAH